MSVVSSLMYAAASVALMALLLECCCRRRLKRLRDSPHVIAMNEVNITRYPVVSPYPIPTTCPGGAPYPTAPGAYPMPVPRAVPIDDTVTTPAYYVTSFPPPAPNVQHVETPPPSYEQVMAGGVAPPPPFPRPPADVPR